MHFLQNIYICIKSRIKLLETKTLIIRYKLIYKKKKTAMGKEKLICFQATLKKPKIV